MIPIRYKIFVSTLFLFCVTISPLLNLIWTELTFYLIVLILIFVIIEFIKSTSAFIFRGFFLVLLAFLVIQLMFIRLNLFQFQLSIYRFLIIPIVAFYSVHISLKSDVKLSFYITPPIILGIGIVYYRIFFDYTFFGLVELDLYEKFSDNFSYGSTLWRPSSLESPIIFSMQLVLFLFYFLNQSNSDRKHRMIMRILFIISFFPLLVMRSRSAFIVLLISFSIILIYQKIKLKSILYLIALVWTLYFTINNVNLGSVFSLNDESYSVRSSSVINSLNQFTNGETKNLFLGFGSGYSNVEINKNEGFNMYVENFFLSYLIDYGILFFLPFCIFNFWLLYKCLLSKNLYFFSFSIFLLTNFFSSNLTAYSIQFLYWIFVFNFLLTSTKIFVYKNIY